MVATVVAMAALGTLGAGKARAAELTVTNTDNSGPGSLRAAIGEANSNAQSDTITFEVTGQITINSRLTLRNDTAGPDLTIEGPGAGQLSVSGNDSSQVFEIDSGVNATIESLTIKDGVFTSGGGIFNFGTLTLNNATVRDNTGNNFGGGIRNIEGNLTLNNSTVRNNIAKDFLGGGGIASELGTVTLNNSTVSNNSGADVGGGIRNIEGNLTLNNSTISGNETTRGGGGGIYTASVGVTRIESTTITNNSASDGQGGGLLILDNPNFETEVEVASSIIAGNTDSDIDYPGGEAASIDLSSEGYNVVGSGNATDAFDQQGDKVIGEADPGLGPLQDNGGPTPTHAVQQGSPALDNGPEGPCNVATDQRGVTRPQDGDGNGSVLCDSGSFEREAETTPPPVVADKANLSLTKKASKGRSTVGTKITYTLRVKNNGPDRATRVKIVDTLPKGVKVLSTSKGCRKLSARKVVCNIARLGDGRSVAKKIVVKVNRAGKLVNKARTSSSVRDPNSRNNSARAVVRAKAKAKAAPKFKQISCKVKDPTVRLVQGKQVVVADSKPGKSVACVIQGNQLALAKALKNQNLGLVKQGGKQVRAAKGKVVKSGARRVVVRVPRGF
ncbi:MAG: choice-of-anchor Q domain-containing protein [Rubrobacteraceae bacterium]